MKSVWAQRTGLAFRRPRIARRRVNDGVRRGTHEPPENVALLRKWPRLSDAPPRRFARVRSGDWLPADDWPRPRRAHAAYPHGQRLPLCRTRAFGSTVCAATRSSTGARPTKFLATSCKSKCPSLICGCIRRNAPLWARFRFGAGLFALPSSTLRPRRPGCERHRTENHRAHPTEKACPRLRRFGDIIPSAIGLKVPPWSPFDARSFSWRKFWHCCSSSFRRWPGHWRDRIGCTNDHSRSGR